ncbi:MAG: hypothetical protein QM739_11800 [Propionivibrio sp.]
MAGILGTFLALGMWRMSWRHGGMSFDELMFCAELWMYQISCYAILNLLDDPAWLALIFC